MPYVKPNPKAKKSTVSKSTVAKQVASGAKKAASGTKNYIRDEMLGFDDFGRVASKAKSGDVLGAAKSGLTGVGELGLTAASIVAGFFSGGTGAVAIQGAKAGAKQAVKTGVKEATKKTATTTAAAATTKEANKASATASKPGGIVDDIGDAVRGGLSGITKKFWIPKPGAPKGGQFKDDNWNPNRPVPTTKPPLKPMDTGGGRVTRGTTVTEAPPSSTGLRNYDTPFNPYSPKMNPWPGMPAVKPAPAPRKPVVPKPTTPKVKPQPAKPDAVTPAFKPSTQTKAQTKTETSTKVETSVKATTKPVLKTPPARVPIRIPIFLDTKDDETKPDRWSPSAIV